MSIFFSVSSLRLGEILALSYSFYNKYSCYKEIEEQYHSFGLYPVTGKFSFLVWSTCYKPFDSESFILSEQFHIWKSDLGIPLLIGGLAFSQRRCYLGLSPVTNSVFSCHYWHLFQNAFTFTVSSSVVATLYCVFTIKKLPSTEDSNPQLRFVL